jgi:hypothetical protein
MHICFQVDVALSLLQQFPQMPLAHKSVSKYESDGIQPLHALASMLHVFPSGTTYGSIQRFIYKSKTILFFVEEKIGIFVTLA